MKAPDFWQEDALVSRLLIPFGAVYAAAGRLRRAVARPYRAPVPVICVGNLTAGGTGKTPTVVALLRRLMAMDLIPHAVSRGYGGSEPGPHRVDAAHDAPSRVGDEPLLLAAEAPAWIARDRAAGIRAAVAAGAEVIVLDDGHQNPGFARDLSIVVVDGAAAFGNGRVIPAGPLRETLSDGLARTDAVIVIGDPRPELAGMLAEKDVFTARITPRFSGMSLTGTRVFAFAGIGRPEKFFETLRKMGAEVVDSESFPDHHVYGARILERLLERAASQGLTAVTTEKDMVKLPRSARGKVWPVPVDLVFDDPEALDRLLRRVTNRDHSTAGVG